MQWTDRNKQIKYLLIVAAVIIATVSLVFSHVLVKNLEEEARSKMSVWAEAMRSLNTADDNTDLNLVLKVINTNTTIPILVLDEEGKVLDSRNINKRYENEADSLAYLERCLSRMREDGNAIKITLDAQEPADSTVESTPEYLEILYEDSVTLRRLAVFPYIQLGVAGIFVLTIVFALLSSKRAEQNRVWVGLSKETAHQLGTPISSLMGWTEILKENYPEDSMIPELEKDVNRLNLIAERFSKVGSQPEFKEENICDVLWRVADYISLRSSDKIKIVCNFPSTPVMISMSAPLFEWVIENLCKNAIDAMSGRGQILLTVHEITGLVIIEVSDTGKGIAKNHFKSVFAPGFTTKKRGWGLGLSLAKRIVEKYHRGKIYVKSSEIGKGTTFRIELRK
jgi:signal transduction histidine kinase